MAFRKHIIIWLSVLVIVTSSNFSYGVTLSDVNQVTWAQESIQFMIDKGFISGYSNGTFMPQNVITRAELITIINKMNNFTEEKIISFNDVKSSDWYHKEVAKAVYAGVANGFPDNTFKPNDAVTREQVAVILNNLYGFENKTDVFTILDFNNISSWAKDAVGNIVGSGIMKGYPDGKFLGKNPITRAEVAVVLNKIYEKFGQVSVEIDQISQPIVSNPSSGVGDSTSGSQTIENSGLNIQLKSVIEKFGRRVTPKLTTELQLEAASIITSSVNKYIADNTYNINSDVETAKTVFSRMTESEYTIFKNTIMSNIPSYELSALNDVFKLVNN